MVTYQKNRELYRFNLCKLKYWSYKNTNIKWNNNAGFLQATMYTWQNKDSSLLWFEALPLGQWFMMFETIMVPSTCQESLIKWYTVTSQRTWILGNTTVRTPNPIKKMTLMEKCPETEYILHSVKNARSPIAYMGTKMVHCNISVQERRHNSSLYINSKLLNV
jgi:hypothetical protein